MIITLILSLVVAIAAVMFSLENPQVVHIAFYGHTYQAPIGVFLLVVLGIGMVLGVLLMVPSLLRRDLALTRHKRRVQELEGAFPRDVDEGNGGR